MDELTPMHNPPHPGEFLASVYLEPFGVSGVSSQRNSTSRLPP